MISKKALRVFSLFSVLFAYSISSVFAQAPAPTPTAPGGRYVSKAKGYSVQFPSDWTQKPSTPPLDVVALSPKDGPTDAFYENVNIIVSDLPQAISSEEYYQLSYPQTKTLQGFKEDSNGKSTVGGIEAHWLIALHSTNNLPIKMMQYYFTKGTRAYVITCTASVDTFAKFKPQFEAIANSFKFE